MEVIISKLSGFCPGVKKAENKLFQERYQNPEEKMYILGQLIHNRIYIDYLEDHNIITEEEIERIPEKSTVFIRTHGLDRERETALKKRCEVIDLTCNIVKDLQNLIKRYSKKNYFIIISGKKKHPEVLGLKSYADHYLLLENEKDLEKMVQEFEKFTLELKKQNSEGILVVSQTTGKLSFYDQVCSTITSLIQDKWPVECVDSICSITSRREKCALQWIDDVDMCFIIGDKTSSNANKLYDILKREQEKVWFISDLKELKDLELNLTSDMKAMVVSSSSTPDFVQEMIVAYLRKI